MKKRLLSLLLVLSLCIIYKIAGAAAAEQPQNSEQTVEVYNQYIGMIHEHSLDSDGLGTPDEAYTTARDELEYDFFGLSDHSHFFRDYEEFADQLAIAKSYDVDGKFITLPGFEMTWDGSGGWWGHMNAYDTGWIHTTRTAGDTLENFYDQLKQSPAAFAQFNHPGYSWGNFDDYNYYDPEIDNIIDLIELKPAYEAEYVRALDKEWHVSPMYQDDNHTASWGQNGAASVIIAKSLTHADLVEGIKANRTYATRDRYLRVDFTGNGEVMGSRLSGIDKLTLNIKADYSTGVIDKISIITNGGLVAAEKTINDRTADWSVDVPVGDKQYYFARVTTTNGKYAYSAPIWVENGNGLVISDTDIGTNTVDSDNFYEIKFNLSNTTNETLTDISVELYHNGNSLEGKWVLPMLPAGGKKEIRVPSAYLEKSKVVNIAVKCTNKNRIITDSANAYLPELLMTELLVSTYSDESVFNAYKFIEVYNATPTEKNLANYSLKYHTHFGRLEEMATSDITESMSIPPQGTVVIWLKDEANPEIAALSEKEFCKFYSNRISPSSVVCVDYSDYGDPFESQNGHDFYLVTDNGDVTSYIRYNYGLQVGGDVYANSSIKYTYSKDGRYLGIVNANSEAVTPGKVTAAQVPYTAQGATIFEAAQGIKLTGSDVTVAAADVAAADAANGTCMVYVNSTGDTNVTVENAALSELAVSSKFKALQIETGFGGAVISGLAADALVKAAGGENVTFQFTKKTDGTKANLDLAILAGSTELSALGTPVLAVIPFAGTGDMQAVYAARGENGKAVTVVPSVYSGKDGGVLAKVSVGGTYLALSNPAAFEDVDGHWAKDYISFLSARSVVGGYNGQFNPAGQITRAEFTKILAAVAGANVSEYTPCAFSDVAKDAWYLPYVSWAAEKGIVGGRSEKVFDPNGKVTREEMALMIGRLATNVLSYPLAQGTGEQFADDASISSYAKDAVYAMRAGNIIGGKENNKFDPKGKATRAEAVKMIVVLILNTISK